MRMVVKSFVQVLLGGCAVVVFFLLFHPYYLGGLTLGYFDFPILIDKLGHTTLIDAIRGVKTRSLSGFIAEIARENVAGRTVDLYMGHPLYIIINLYSFAFCRMFGDVSYKMAGSLLSTIMGTIGVGLFFGILRHNGVKIFDAACGSLFLCFSWYYSRNMYQCDAGICAVLSAMIVVYSYYKLLEGQLRLARVLLFWIIFPFASLLYMNTVPLAVALSCVFFLRVKSVLWSAYFIFCAFVGFAVLYCSMDLLLRNLAEMGVWVFSTDLFQLFECLADLYKIIFFGIPVSILDVPRIILQKIGGLFFPPYDNSISFVLGVLIVYCVCFVIAFQAVNRKSLTQNWLLPLFMMAAYLGYFIYTKHMFDSHIYMPLLIPIAYFAAVGFSYAREGVFPSWSKPKLIRNGFIALIIIQAVICIVYSMRPALPYGETFCKLPARDKLLLSREFFSFVRAHTEDDALVLYDSGYVDRVLGSMLLLYADRISPLNYTANITFLSGLRGVNSSANVRDNVPLREIVSKAGSTSIYLLASIPDVEWIAIPSDDTLVLYSMFKKKVSQDSWGLYAFSPAVHVTPDMINRSIALKHERCLQIEAGRQYRKQDVHWERIALEHVSGTALVVVPSKKGAAIDTKERYLCYW